MKTDVLLIFKTLAVPGVVFAEHAALMYTV